MGLENNIPEGWVETTVGDTCELLDCLHRTPKYSNFGYPMVRVTDVKNGPLETNGCLKVDVNTFNDFSKNYQPKIGDIVFTRVGSFGLSAIVKKEEQFCIGQNTTLILAKRINSFFLFYYLISKAGRHQIVALSSGSTQPTISMASIREIQFNLPPLPEQKAIAKILTAFDDKIELLHAQNKTLETMAQTIFKEWFGKYQIGDELPEGWNQYNFIDLVKHIKPGTNYQPKRVESGIPFINGRHVKNGVIHFRDIKYITEEEYERVHKSWKPEKNDILITRIGTLGNVGIIQKTDLPLALHYNSINIKEDKLTHQFIYFLLKSEYFQQQFHFNKKQSVQEFVTIEAVEQIKISIPSSEILEEKTKCFDNILLKILNNNSQIKSLIKTRDTLLPKLMSGQVRVNNLKQTADA
jgi:type I restriction enzyme S subunit